MESIKVAYLLNKYPAACTIKDNKGNLPLHVAVFARNDNSVQHVGLLLDVYEGAAREINANGAYPVFNAIGYEMFDEAIRLIQKFPFVVDIEDGKGLAPLVDAFFVRFGDDTDASYNFVRHLIEKDPNSCKVMNQFGELPLHCALKDGTESSSTLSLMINSNRDALKTPDRRGNLPLHISVSYPPTFWRISTLIDEYRNAIHEYNHDGELPLHCLFRRGSNGDPYILEWLDLKYCQKLSFSTRKKGNTVLHIACKVTECGNNEMEITWLLEHYPKLSSCANKKGKLPLHVAAAWGTMIDFNILKQLIDKYPGALQIKDYKGRLPLHHLLVPSLEIPYAKTFIDRYPVAVREKDNEGCLPLHVLLRQLGCPEPCRTFFVLE
jgi:ankyrin repeat protein